MWRLRRWKISISGGSQAGNWWLPRRIIFTYPKTGKFTGVGIFTVVEEKDGWGLLKAYQEKRDGWISLAFTTRI